MSRGRIRVLIEELVELTWSSELCCSSCLMEFEVSRGRIRVLIVLADRAWSPRNKSRFFELCCSSCLMEFEVSRGRISVLIEELVESS